MVSGKETEMKSKKVEIKLEIEQKKIVKIVKELNMMFLINNSFYFEILFN